MKAEQFEEEMGFDLVDHNGFLHIKEDGEIKRDATLEERVMYAELRRQSSEIERLEARVKELEAGLRKIHHGMLDELDPDWPCNSYHPNFLKAESVASALLEKSNG